MIDVAMTETARNADHVLPASTSMRRKPPFLILNIQQLFPFEYPIFNPPKGSETLPEAEIHSRLLSAIGEMPGEITFLKLI